jgi:methyl coenzyme M reductase alpha subunit
MIIRNYIENLLEELSKKKASNDYPKVGLRLDARKKSFINQVKEALEEEGYRVSDNGRGHLIIHWGGFKMKEEI